jgi:catechol 2,3-dioxygenase-like lactoylglutathione lyase family enzyme
MSKAKPIPDGVSVVMPMLVCRDVAAAIDFCKTTFGAEEVVRRPGPDGTVAHAALTIGGAMVMIEGEWPTLASRAPQPDGSSPVVIYLYVEGVDKVIERGSGRRGEGPASSEEPVLGRPHRADHRSVGARVDHLHSRRGDFVR